VVDVPFFPCGAIDIKLGIMFASNFCGGGIRNEAQILAFGLWRIVG
jgi:hypothetical protein